jgi:hypothetical protein
MTRQSDPSAILSQKKKRSRQNQEIGAPHGYPLGEYAPFAQGIKAGLHYVEQKDSDQRESK